MKAFLYCLAISLFTLSTGHAQGSHTGGGDQCKNEIEKHRIMIKGWIERDEAKDLNFSAAKVKNLSYRAADANHSYQQRMLSVLSEGKVIITCYLDPARLNDSNAQRINLTEGVSYKSIQVGEHASPTTCINYEDARGFSHIDCNYDLIMNQNSLGNPNYKTTHHEFASIAGVEMRASDPSDMSISDQLSQYEHLALMKVLGPKVSSAVTLFTDLRDRESQLRFSYDSSDDGICLRLGKKRALPGSKTVGYLTIEKESISGFMDVGSTPQVTTRSVRKLIRLDSILIDEDGSMESQVYGRIASSIRCLD